MRFGTRLILFFTLTLLTVQVGTGLAIRSLLRNTLVDDGTAQVETAGARFTAQLSELGNSMAEGVRLLTLDFALRRSIADHDTATVISALHNHGRRVSATRMVMIETSGAISGDTDPAPSDSWASGPAPAFPFPALLDEAASDGTAANVAVIEGKPVWLVVVPVMAPDLIAYVAAVLPLDDARLRRMRDNTGIPGQMGLAIDGPDGLRRAAGDIDLSILSQLPPRPATTTATDAAREESIVVTRSLMTPPNSPNVLVVIAYPLSEALRRYQGVLYVLVPALNVGLILALIGAVTISRGVARPIELLARQTERIASGDYTPPPLLDRRDELGQLSVALRAMTGAIGEREERIRHQATHDPVTGLPNREAFAAAIDAKGDGAIGAILVVGLIRWRDITSTAGRDVGDRLLKAVGERIRNLIANGTMAPLTGSIGESSFAVFLEHAGHGNAVRTAARVIAALDTPHKDGDLTIDATVAAGIAFTPEHGTGAAQLLRRAEVALQTARGTETRAEVYRPETDPHRRERLSLMSDLRAGLEHGEFELVYQPKLDLAESRIIGAEALIRWNHPVNGLIRPDDFIPLAEETGNIQHVTRWALKSGIAEAARWRDQGQPMRVAINLSVRDLSDITLPERVAGLLHEVSLSPRALILEVTESAIMGEPDAAIAVLRRLDDMGVALAIDDFGVGQSSLAYLRRLPVRELKLDKTFILRLPHSQDDQTIVRSVIELGHTFGYRVTAEGVEDPASLDLLRSFGCDHAQGYFIAKPLPAASLLSFAAAWRVPKRDAAERIT